jgi:hypothetical protein
VRYQRKQQVVQELHQRTERPAPKTRSKEVPPISGGFFNSLKCLWKCSIDCYPFPIFDRE